MTLVAILTAVAAGLPLMNTVAVLVLGWLHVKNAKAIADAGTAVTTDALTIASGGSVAGDVSKIITNLPQIIQDAHTAGVALGVGLTKAPDAPALTLGEPLSK
jgi:hypothetical protein